MIESRIRQDPPPLALNRQGAALTDAFRSVPILTSQPSARARRSPYPNQIQDFSSACPYSLKVERRNRPNRVNQDAQSGHGTLTWHQP